MNSHGFRNCFVYKLNSDNRLSANWIGLTVIEGKALDDVSISRLQTATANHGFYRSRISQSLEAVLVNFDQVIGDVLYQGKNILRNQAAAVVFGLVGWCMLPAFIPSTGVAYGQNTNATIRGQVLDATGALVPDAQVVILNKNTGVTVFDGKTDSAGAFVAPQVIPGTYKVTVSASGLRDAVIDNLVATVAQVASADVNMQVSVATEVVTVQSKNEELDRSTSDVSTLIAPQEVQHIPLQQRATENLLAFIPGVVHGGAGNQPSTSQLSINGSRTLNTEVLLNGVSTIIASTGAPATLPSPDGVDQFRVLTTNAPAEYGRTLGRCHLREYNLWHQQVSWQSLLPDTE
jgi:hypothetical protein